MDFVLSIVFISVIGTLLHFTYDISNHNMVVGLFSAVNESTWEHIKMALTATFLWSIYDGFKYFSNPNYFIAKAVSLIIIIAVIPAIFYGYKFALKRTVLAIDISAFYIAIILSQFGMKKVIFNQDMGSSVNFIGVILTAVIFAVYLLATLLPLKNFLFLDPITKKFGEQGHSDTVKK